MKRVMPIALGAILTMPTLALLPFTSQTSHLQPLTLHLDCPGGDCPLLRGTPQTAGMRSGFVRLKPGETVGWHTTDQNEESLVVLHGRGEALVEGQPARPFTAPGLLYIPPLTRHNIANTGDVLLEYVYVVAPVTGSQQGRPNKN